VTTLNKPSRDASKFKGFGHQPRGLKYQTGAARGGQNARSASSPGVPSYPRSMRRIRARAQGRPRPSWTSRGGRAPRATRPRRASWIARCRRVGWRACGADDMHPGKLRCRVRSGRNRDCRLVWRSEKSNKLPDRKISELSRWPRSIKQPAHCRVCRIVGALRNVMTHLRRIDRWMT
jgi:hypothetical protein